MSPETPATDLTPRQQFGQRLRELRERAGLLSMDLARQIGISPDLASRGELGERWLKPEVVKDWVAALADDDQVAEMLTFLKDMRERESRLRVEAQKPKLAQDFRSDLFRKAARIRTFALTDIPFYLQTAEYARGQVGDVAGAADIVALRRAANEAVGSEPKNFEIILAESALRYAPCSARAMRAQLIDLQRLVGAPGVEIGVIAFGAQIDAPMKSAFSVFDEITLVESSAGAIDLTPKSAGRYIELMDRLWDEAVRGEEVRKILTAAANALPAA